MSNNNFIPETAVCPFCRRFTKTTSKIARDCILKSEEDFQNILANKINYTKCSNCGESFYYECNCYVVNSKKNYAIALSPMGELSLKREKSVLFNIIKKNDFKLRVVKEFIYLAEKVRIFEFHLDDRVMEIVKYKYVASPHKLDTKSKIILTGADDKSLEFTVFDDYDKVVAKHRISAEAYKKIAQGFTKEIIDSPTLIWKAINLEWAKKYTKENLI